MTSYKDEEKAEWKTGFQAWLNVWPIVELKQ